MPVILTVHDAIPPLIAARPQRFDCLALYRLKSRDRGAAGLKCMCTMHARQQLFAYYCGLSAPLVGKIIMT